MTTTVTAETEKAQAPKPRKPHPIRDLIIKRSLIGILTLVLVSILVFVATQTLPGNAASAVLQNTATPARLAALEKQLGLNRPAVEQYWTWLTGVLHGNFGTSLYFYPASVSSVVRAALPWPLGLVGVTTILAFVLNVEDLETF